MIKKWILVPLAKRVWSEVEKRLQSVSSKGKFVSTSIRMFIPVRIKADVKVGDFTPPRHSYRYQMPVKFGCWLVNGEQKHIAPL